jgi:hypothetical protein
MLKIEILGVVLEEDGVPRPAALSAMAQSVLVARRDHKTLRGVTVDPNRLDIVTLPIVSDVIILAIGHLNVPIYPWILPLKFLSRETGIQRSGIRSGSGGK